MFYLQNTKYTKQNKNKNIITDTDHGTLFFLLIDFFRKKILLKSTSTVQSPQQRYAAHLDELDIVSQ